MRRVASHDDGRQLRITSDLVQRKRCQNLRARPQYSNAGACRISVANFVEVAIVVEAQTEASGRRQFDAFFRRAGIVIEPVTEEQSHTARQAYTDFGKGRHRAGINFGDGFAYALAKTTGETVLVKGEDFRKTNISSAI